MAGDGLNAGCATFAMLIGWICGVIGLTWAPWSQTDILLNKDPSYANFSIDCPDCHMISKLTQYRAPGYWCLAVRQQVYTPEAPPPPPPIWRRLSMEEETGPYNLEPEHSSFTETTSSFDKGPTFHKKTWENVTCVPDAWYFDTCVRKETDPAPDGCGAERKKVQEVLDTEVPTVCTEEIYANHTVDDVGPWGDCYFPSDDASKVNGDDYCYPQGSVNAAGEVCTCKCGKRCQDKLDICPEAYTAEARYNLAVCEAKELVCEGTSTIYGVAVSGLFFASIALIPYMASGYIKNYMMARAVLQLAVALTLLSWVLYVGAMGWWHTYVNTMNEPRQIFLESLYRVDLFDFDLYHPKRPNFFVQYLNPNPFTWERYLKAPAYLQLKEQFEWNWGWNFLSGGFYVVITATAFQTLAMMFGYFALREKPLYDPPPEKPAASDV